MKILTSLVQSVLLSLLCGLGVPASGDDESQLVLKEEVEHSDIEPHWLSGTPLFSSHFGDLIPDRPFSSVSSMFDEMVRTQDRFLSDFWKSTEEFPSSPVSHPFLRRRVSSPLLLRQQQYVDSDEKFQISFHLPLGMSSNDIHVEVQNGGTYLVIHGQTGAAKSTTYAEGDNDPTTSFQQFTSTSFSQSFSLDPRVNIDHLVATVKDGLLTVSGPKDNSKLNNMNRVIPVQDLDAIAANVATLESRVKKSKLPAFLHAKLPFVKDPAGTAQNIAEHEMGKENQKNESLPDGNSITDGWREVSTSSL